MSWLRVSFASWSTTSLPSMPQWLGTQQKWTRAFVAQCPEEVHDMTNERVFCILALNRLQARHWVRVEYNIVLYRVHVPIIVQCQGNGCSLSSKDGAVIRESVIDVLTGLVLDYTVCSKYHSACSLKDWICLTTTHVLQDILAVLHK